MAAELSGSGEDNAPIAGINVTPFVDVVLVLLVIFMVTAPILMKDTLGITLPKAAHSDQKTVQTLGLAITKEGQLLLNGQLATPEGLAEEVRKAVAANTETQAIISADVEAKHGDLVKAIDIIKGAGLSKFALQVERQQ